MKTYLFFYSETPASTQQSSLADFTIHNGENLLQRHLRILWRCGMESVLIFSNVCKKLYADPLSYPGMIVQFAAAGESPASYGFSEDGGLLLSGALVYNEAFIQSMLNHQSPDVMAVEPLQEAREALFQVRLDLRFAAEAGKKLTGAGVWACLPAAKIGAAHAARLAPFLPACFCSTSERALDELIVTVNNVLAGETVKYLRIGPPCAAEEARQAYRLKKPNSKRTQYPFAKCLRNKPDFETAQAILQAMDDVVRFTPEPGSVLRLFGEDFGLTAQKLMVVCDETYGNLPLAFLLSHYNVDHVVFEVQSTIPAQAQTAAAAALFIAEGCTYLLSVGGANTIHVANGIQASIHSQRGRQAQPARYTALPLCTSLYEAYFLSPLLDEVILDPNFSLRLSDSAFDAAFSAFLHASIQHVLQCAMPDASDNQALRALYGQSMENVLTGLSALLQNLRPMLFETQMSGQIFDGMCAIALGISQCSHLNRERPCTSGVLLQAGISATQHASATAANWPEFMLAVRRYKPGFSASALCGTANDDETAALVKAYAAKLTHSK